jgi:hypothetical protein
MTIGKGDIYKTYKDLVIHSETTSWNRFASFLVISSILVLAWARLFTADNIFLWHKIVMTGISAFGILGGFVWASLGARGREYLDQYKKKAIAIETNCDKQNWWEDGIEITDRPFQIDIKPKPYSSSRTLLILVPMLFSLLQALLLLATWFGSNTMPKP